MCLPMTRSHLLGKSMHSYDAEKLVTSKPYNVSKNREKRLPDEKIVFNLSPSRAFYDLPVRQSSRPKICGHIYKFIYIDRN